MGFCVPLYFSQEEAFRKDTEMLIYIDSTTENAIDQAVHGLTGN